MGFINTTATLGTQFATANAVELSRALLAEQIETNRLLRKMADEPARERPVSHILTPAELRAQWKAERAERKAALKADPDE